MTTSKNQYKPINGSRFNITHSHNDYAKTEIKDNIKIWIPEMIVRECNIEHEKTCKLISIQPSELSHLTK